MTDTNFRPLRVLFTSTPSRPSWRLQSRFEEFLAFLFITIDYTTIKRSAHPFSYSLISPSWSTSTDEASMLGRDHSEGVTAGIKSVQP